MTPPFVARARITSSDLHLGCFTKARQFEWVIRRGLVEASMASSDVRSFACETSMAIPHAFIAWTTSLPKSERPVSFRSPHPEGVEDTPDKVDFDRLARVTRLLGELVTTLAEAPAEGLGPDAAPGADDDPPAASAPGDLMPALPPLEAPAAVPKNPG